MEGMHSKQPDAAGLDVVPSHRGAGRSTGGWHRFLRRLLVVALVAVGSTVVVATSAAAAVGGCDSANPTVTACVNFGDSGNRVRAGFYFKKPPDYVVVSIYTLRGAYHTSSVSPTIIHDN